MKGKGPQLFRDFASHTNFHTGTPPGKLFVDFPQSFPLLPNQSKRIDQANAAKGILSMNDYPRSEIVLSSNAVDREIMR